MKINKVSLDGDLDRFGGRALIIKTDRGSIKTPQRVLTSSEIQYKAKLPFEPTLKNDVSEIVAQFNDKQWDSFMNTNGSFDSRLRRIEFYSDKMAYTCTKLYPQFHSSIDLGESAIKQLLELQRMSKLDFITFPNISSPIQDFEKMAASFSGEVISERREPLIYLDMGLDIPIFRDRLMALLELSKTDLIHTIGLIYRPIRKNIQNYRTIWENRESNVFFQMSDVPREFNKTTAVSTMHLLQKWGIDSFSVRIGNYVPSRSTEQEPLPKTEALKNTKRFDPDPLTFRRFHTWGSREESLNCSCPICHSMTVEEFQSEYNSESEEYAGQVFNAANRLHEFYRSSDEFNESREYIRTGDLSEYFKTKPGLKKSDISVPPKLNTLNGWL